MAALEGFSINADRVDLSAPPALSQTLLSVAVPARAVVAGVDLIADRLDIGSPPTITLDIGDVDDPTRYAITTLAQGGGTLEARLPPHSWWRYLTPQTVAVTVSAAPAIGVVGSLGLSVYWFPASDYAALRRMVLQELMVLQSGEELSADDDEVVTAALSEVHETLEARRFGRGSLRRRLDLAWPLELVPDFAARSYARLAAERLMTIYSLGETDRARVERNARLAEIELARQTMVHRSRGTPADYERQARELQHDDDGMRVRAEYF